MPVSYTYEPDYNSATVSVALVTRLRQEIGDTNIANDGVDAVFSDQEILSIAREEGDDFNLQVARLYEVLASNSALYIGKQSFMNNFVDGAAISVELHRMADHRRAMYHGVV